MHDDAYMYYTLADVVMQNLESGRESSPSSFLFCHLNQCMKYVLKMTKHHQSGETKYSKSSSKSSKSLSWNCTWILLFAIIFVYLLPIFWRNLSRNFLYWVTQPPYVNMNQICICATLEFWKVLSVLSKICQLEVRSALFS